MSVWYNKNALKYYNKIFEWFHVEPFGKILERSMYINMDEIENVALTELIPNIIQDDNFEYGDDITPEEKAFIQNVESRRGVVAYFAINELGRWNGRSTKNLFKKKWWRRAIYKMGNTKNENSNGNC